MEQIIHKELGIWGRHLLLRRLRKWGEALVFNIYRIQMIFYGAIRMSIAYTDPKRSLNTVLKLYVHRSIKRDHITGRTKPIDEKYF